MITLTVLAILIMGTLPLAQNSVRRQRENRLRETLRQVRTAIDEFKRDTLGACPAGAITTGDPTRRDSGTNVPSDPRSRVVIDECTIFDNENLDRYPPDLDVLVNGVKVRQRGMNATAAGGVFGENATDLNATDEIVKAYLRQMPIDPMTGESDWKLRSSYQEKDSESWDNINVFDIRSASDEEGLNGVKYSDW
ncbi:MAG: type II secretion system protein [Blastocatellia bacterium]|nr:type II secretion system protein [Blastocatellia bacterium]